jgi:pimeloyl-ACP methyl ester carboxylesterase
MPDEKAFETGTVTLNYLEYGPATLDPLVMLHGGAWRWQEYLSLIPHLGQRCHIYALDLRGNGRSGWVPDHYCLEDFTADTGEFVRRLNRPAVLLGHSLGGVIALMVAGRCPENVKALILEDVPLTLENYQRVIDASREMFGLWLELKKAAHTEQDLALALADNYQEYPGVTSAWIWFFATCLWQLDPTFFNPLRYDFAGFAKGYDAQQILGRLTCPILFIRGETKLGAVLTEEEIAWLTQHCSQARCAQIRGVGHLLHLQDQGQTPVLTAMLTFLEGVSSC